MSDELETWRAVVGHEGLYEVSDLGRVRRDPASPVTSANARAGRVLKPVPRDGYLRVRLYRNGEFKSVGVHNLVAAAFLGAAPEGHIPNHKDGIKHNCRLSNLEYLTQSGNQLHAYATGLSRPCAGEKQGASKLTWEAVREIRRRLAAGEKQIPLAEEFGISQSNISEIKQNTIWVESGVPYTEPEKRL